MLHHQQILSLSRSNIVRVNLQPSSGFRVSGIEPKSFLKTDESGRSIFRSSMSHAVFDESLPSVVHIFCRSCQLEALSYTSIV